MKLTTLARTFTAVALLGSAGLLKAADQPVAPPPPTTVIGAMNAPCATCATTGAVHGPACKSNLCPTCLPWRKVPPFKTHLCPGACFGYFQTQWSKWEDVCPLPYQGQGFSDAPAQRTSPVTPVRPATDPKKPADVKKPAEGLGEPKKMPDPKGGEIPGPRPGSGASQLPNGGVLPKIPQAPGNLPIPNGRFGS